MNTITITKPTTATEPANAGTGTDYYTAPMQPGDIETLARLLVRQHNGIAEKRCSFYGANMDRALCKDTFAGLFVAGDYAALCEIRSHFVEVQQ